MWKKERKLYFHLDCSQVGDLLCLFLWYMGDIYSFMHKSTSYQCFCMTDQTCPPLYFVTQYVGARTIHKLSPDIVFALQTYDLGSYLSRPCIILSASLSTLFLLFFFQSTSWILIIYQLPQPSIWLFSFISNLLLSELSVIILEWLSFLWPFESLGPLCTLGPWAFTHKQVRQSIPPSRC